jgi:alanine dehydrogenase
MMIFGVPKEINPQEKRVGALPFLVKELVKKNNQVLIETGAGEHCEASDSFYEQVGATIVPSPEKLYSQADIILKVWEPKPVEFELIRPDQILLAFFHFLSNPELIKTLASRGSTCLAYDLVYDKKKLIYPFLLPLSSITGQMAVINGAFYLQKQFGGRGIVLSSISGLPPATVTILGAGNVGHQAAQTACTLGAKVVVLDTNYEKLVELELLNHPHLTTAIYSENTLRKLLKETDMLISCVYVPEKSTPLLVTTDMVKSMKAGAVIVAVDIDHGGSIETGKKTSHDIPTYIVDGVVHYCVANITAGVPVIASRGLNTALSPYLSRISEIGFEKSIMEDPNLANGVVIYKGHLVKEYFASKLELPYSNLLEKVKEFISEE